MRVSFWKPACLYVCQVKLWCDCPFWPDDGMCRLRDCSVCECPENDFPETFKNPNRGFSSEDLVCQEGKPQAAVDRTLDSKGFRGWTDMDNPWTNDDETDNGMHSFGLLFELTMLDLFQGRNLCSLCIFCQCHMFAMYNHP